MPYYEIKVHQLLAEGVDKFEVVFNPKTETEFVVPIEFFALCDLIAKPCVEEAAPDEAESCFGVILPVTFDEDEGLQPELLSFYKPASEQEVRLRKKE